MPLHWLIAVAALQAHPVADTVTRDSLLRELPAATVFEILATPSDTVPGLFQNRKASRTLYLSSIYDAAPSALMWLLEGSRAYDRETLLAEFAIRDSARMRDTLYSRLQQDQPFTNALLALMTPLLRARGTVVTRAMEDAPAELTVSGATALAARYFQVQLVEGRPVIMLCAKPSRLRRVAARNDVVESWMYSVLRSTVQTNGLMPVADSIARSVVASRPGAGVADIEHAMWERLASHPVLQALITSEYAKAEHWVPLRLSGPAG